MTHEFLLAGSPDSAALYAHAWGWKRLVDTGDFLKCDGTKVHPLSRSLDLAKRDLIRSDHLPLVHLTPDAHLCVNFAKIAQMVADEGGFLVGPWKVSEEAQQRIGGG